MMPSSKPSTSEPISLTRLKLALHLTPHIGERTLVYVLRRLVVERMSPSEFLSLHPDVWTSEFALKQEAADALADGKDALLKASEVLSQALRLYGIALLTLGERGYPARLEQNDAIPPPLLYALGNLSLLSPASQKEPPHFTFALALSNDPAPEALEKQDEIARTLALAGGIAVTGHDRLPYQRLALSLQRLNKPTLYVLDKGIRKAMKAHFEAPLFPAARIRETEFEKARDLVISPFRPDDNTLAPHSLRRRDRLIFALADVIIAVDVNPGGGMFTECKVALKAGRSVFVAEGGREGNQKLKALGAKALDLHPLFASQIS